MISPIQEPTDSAILHLTSGQVVREVKHDVDGRRQTAKITSDFELFSVNL